MEFIVVGLSGIRYISVSEIGDEGLRDVQTSFSRGVRLGCVTTRFRV